MQLKQHGDGPINYLKAICYCSPDLCTADGYKQGVVISLLASGDSAGLGNLSPVLGCNHSASEWLASDLIMTLDKAVFRGRCTDQTKRPFAITFAK